MKEHHICTKTEVQRWMTRVRRDSAEIWTKCPFSGNLPSNLIFGLNLMFFDQLDGWIWSNCTYTSCLCQDFDEKASHSDIKWDSSNSEWAYGQNAQPLLQILFPLAMFLKQKQQRKRHATVTIVLALAILWCETQIGTFLLAKESNEGYIAYQYLGCYHIQSLPMYTSL